MPGRLRTGLSGGAEDHRGAADLREKAQRQVEQCEEMAWHRLHLVDHKDAAAEGMEAADAAAAPGKEGVQQLEQGSNYDWGLPCCRQKLPAVQFLLRFRGIRLRLLHDVGVVLQN